MIRTQQQKSYHVTASKARDELFNRLVAMGGDRFGRVINYVYIHTHMYMYILVL